MNFPNFDPVAIAIGPLEIRWYALAYITGIVLAWRYVLWLVAKPPRLLTRDNCDDLVTWCTVGIILGGRLGQVFLWQPDYYLAHPIEIFKIWKGGMAFHGGLLGVILAMFLYARTKKIPFFAVADPIAAATPIGLFLGRIANFINGELWGRTTDMPWGIIFPGAGPEPRHPSQLYEATMEGIILFIAMFLLARRESVRSKIGTLSGAFLIGYAIARIVGEQFREPEVALSTSITWGQWLSVPMFLYGVYLVWRAKPIPPRPAASPPQPTRPVTQAVTGNVIAHELRRRIAAQGHVSVAEFMELVLGAYYSDRDPLGSRGDFTTAPEVSQMFGEMIGLWCVDLWSRMGKPAPFILAELGPGRGTLMADALRAARVAPDFLAAAELHLVEINTTLIAAQKAALQGFRPQWHKGFDTLPPGPMILVANEFWDALPIHQFVMTKAGWQERVVALKDDTFVFGEAQPGTERILLRPEHGKATLGEIAEISPAGLRLAAALGRRFARSEGAALIIDYGTMQSGLGDSLQALKNHRYHDPLIDPGCADLTAHVDFAALATVAREAGAATHGPTTQGAFLQELGIGLRTETLKAKSDAVQCAEIDAALARLIGADGMGSLFKVLALTSPDSPQPAGL